MNSLISPIAIYWL